MPRLTVLFARFSSFGLAVALSLTFGSAPASATPIVIEFDSAPATAAFSYSEDGFTLDPNGYHFHFNYLGNPVASQNGSIALWNHDAELTLTRTDNTAFSFMAFDAGEIMSSQDLRGQDSNAKFLEVRGALIGGGFVSAIFTLDGFADGNPGLPADFESFVLPSTFQNLASVQFYGTGALDGSPNFFALDNLVVESVPDLSSTLLLLGTGLAGVLIFGRGRRGLPKIQE